jgi:hypothetical protein
VATAFVAIVIVPSRAPATIQEQRERLPPPAEGCDDPISGVWKSHQYDERYRDWTIFMLNIRRSEDNESELVGTIINHSWDASPDDEEPPPCSAGASEWIVSMDARGTISPDGRIFFGGVGQWRLDQVICNWGPGGYNLDNFSGVIDPELFEFQSVNNDGGRAVDDPTVFRRVRCLDAPPSPHVISTPPPFYPDTGGGCSLF